MAGPHWDAVVKKSLVNFSVSKPEREKFAAKYLGGSIREVYGSKKVQPSQKNKPSLPDIVAIQNMYS